MAKPGPKSLVWISMLNWRNIFYGGIWHRWQLEKIEQRLKELGIVLPSLPQPGGNRCFRPGRSDKWCILPASFRFMAGRWSRGRRALDGRLKMVIRPRAIVRDSIGRADGNLGSLDKIKNIVTVNRIR